MESKRILFVEDEFKIADSIKKGLSEHNYLVEIANEGNKGWHLFEQKTFDLVILDINLPGINGFEICKKIRKVNTQVPIIILTAFSSINNKLEGYDCGADDYVVKPFEFKELLMKIRVLLKRSVVQDEMPGNILRVSDLEMNLDSMEVKRNGKKINLTAKEFQLLQFLLEHKNKVLTRADIASNVWEIDFDTNTNVIDVYISYLRNKIDKGFDKKLIQTQVGMGYILKVNE